MTAKVAFFVALAAALTWIGLVTLTRYSRRTAWISNALIVLMAFSLAVLAFEVGNART